MTAMTLFSGANVPAFARTGEISEAAKAMAGGGGMGGKRLSIEGGVFRLYSDGKQLAKIPDRHLEVVIVNAASKIARQFYAGTYDKDNPTPPDCWSVDGNTPDKAVVNPQCASCAQCKQNEKGSGQGDARACRFSQKLAIVLANDINGDVMQLQLPSMSIFGKAENGSMPLQAYTRYLLAQSPPVDPTKLVTKLQFDTDASVPKLFFQPVRWLNDEEYATCIEAGKSPDALKAITSEVFQTDKVATPKMELPGKAPTEAAVTEAKPEPKAIKTKPVTLVKPAPKEYAQQEAAEEMPEPTVRKETKAAPAVQNPKLAQALDEWDD